VPWFAAHAPGRIAGTRCYAAGREGFSPDVQNIEAGSAEHVVADGKKMASEGIKGTIADYIRLMQLHKELDDDAPREIKVTWVEPKGNEATNEAEKTGSGSGE
jgi:hypothetical protein